MRPRMMTLLTPLPRVRLPIRPESASAPWMVLLAATLTGVEPKSITPATVMTAGEAEVAWVRKLAAVRTVTAEPVPPVAEAA